MEGGAIVAQIKRTDQRAPAAKRARLNYKALTRRNLVKHDATFRAQAAYDRGQYVVGRGYKLRPSQECAAD